MQKPELPQKRCLKLSIADFNKKIYLMMNKPRGYVCSAVSDSHHTVYELLPSELQELVQNPTRGNRLHTIGRLDADTSGLLLFTTDGYFSNSLTRPENHVEKTYRITLESPVDTETQKIYTKKCSEGFYIPPEKKGEEFICKSSFLEWKDDLHCILTISEGKFHQVRRMMCELGNKVIELERIKFGEYELVDLKSGEIVFINKV